MALHDLICKYFSGPFGIPPGATSLAGSGAVTMAGSGWWLRAQSKQMPAAAAMRIAVMEMVNFR